MAKLMNEKKVLRKLGIPDFRYMTMDLVGKFTEMVPHMDREVAMKAMDQFPEFVSFSKEMVSHIQMSVDKVLDSSNQSVQHFYSYCDEINHQLWECYNNSDTMEERHAIMNNIMVLMDVMDRKDSEQKHFLTNLVGIVAGAVTVVTVGAIAVLGVKVSGGREDEDYDDYEIE